jgi:hypothetical protein
VLSHDAYQEDIRRPCRLPEGKGFQSPIPALRDPEALERIEILRNLRLGKFDVLVGINLLREGLDLPEVSLVAVLDADKEGFPAFRNHAYPDMRHGPPEISTAG